MNQLIVAFTERLLKLYFEERNLQELLTHLTPDITWVGFGKGEICTNLEEAIYAFKEEGAIFKNTFKLSDYKVYVIQEKEDIYIAFGEFNLQERAAVGTEKFLVRATAILHAEGENIKVSHVHFSHASQEQAEGEFFPHVTIKERQRYLERIIKQKTDALEKKRTYLNVLTDSISGGIYYCQLDEKITILQYNDMFKSILGYTEEEIREKYHNSLLELIHPDDRVEVYKKELQRVNKEGKTTFSYRMIAKNGEVFNILDQGRYFNTGADGETILGVLIDVTEQQKMQEEIRLALERYEIVMNQTSDVIFEWDMKSDTLIYSLDWEKNFGYQPTSNHFADKIGESLHIHPEDKKILLEGIKEVKSGVSYKDGEIRIIKKDRWIWHKLRVSALFDKGQIPIKAIGILIDIDDSKREQLEMQEKAEIDALTGLYNKITSQNKIEHFLGQYKESQLELGALLIMDIDNFKMFNDTYGHMFGDAVISHVANEIKRQFRTSDIIGRLGGDEFVIFMKDIPSSHFAAEKASKLTNILSDLFKTVGKIQKITCSIGIAIYPKHGIGFKELYKSADLALYQAKEKGKGRYEFFDDTLMEDANLNDEVKHTKIDSNNRAKPFKEELVEYVFRILYTTEDVKVAINMILEMIGKHFKVSRVYIFEDSESGEYCNNTFEWCARGIESAIENLQNLSYKEDLGGNYKEEFNEEEVFYCQDITTLPRPQYQLLNEHKVKAVLQCAIKDKGQFKGFIGFDECTGTRAWTQDQVDSLGLLAQILSTFLLKTRAQEKLESYYKG